ncbi:MAG: Ig-like domain-containing protein [Bacteroidota bacterium]
MKKKLLLSSCALFTAAFTFSQFNFTCGNTFYDSGGISGEYGSGENITYLLSPGLPTEAVELVFNSFSTEIDYDVLTIYDNNSATGTPIGAYSGDVDIPMIVAENPTGCLFLVFTSDGSTIAPGWSATVSCVTKPTCFKPTALNIPGKTHHTATLGWTAETGESQWEIEYGPTGFTFGNGTSVTVATNPFLIEGLDDNTSYDVYIRARCGGSNLSYPAGPLNFTTNASPNPAFICGNLFTDEGGSGSDYFNYANDTVVICPSAGQHVSLVFTSFSTEEDYDSLIIFNGNSTSASILGSYDGDLNIGTVTSTSPDGCLTAVFHSDESSPAAGWSAAIVCSGSTNNPPSAVNESVSTPFNTAITVNVLANDSDSDGSLNPASVNVTVASPNGTTSVNTTTGAITFTPTAGFSGMTSFTYQVCDDGTPVLCSTATVSVTVGTNGIEEHEIHTSVYPNPVTDILYVESAQTIKNLAVFSLEGKEIIRSSASQMNVASLSKGVYILESTLENGKISRTQFIKE